MIQIGKFNRLRVSKLVPFGAMLDGGDNGEILLPKRYCSETQAVDDQLEVFLYHDSEDRLVATTERPRVQLHECALLRVKDVNRTGAFLDWGLSKDLLVPHPEQLRPMESGKSYVVTVFPDHQGRLTASSKLNQHLKESSAYLKPWQAVDLLIWGKTPMGYKAVIEHAHLGLIFRDDAYRPLRYGEQLRGYIKCIRDDAKIDLTLQPPVAQQRDQLCEDIIEHLREQGGSSELTDRADPRQIHETFHCSKANYKKALGRLYRERRVQLDAARVILLK